MTKPLKWLVIMQRADRDVNDGIRLSQIFTDKETAETYAQERRESDTDFRLINVVSRSEYDTIPN